MADADVAITAGSGTKIDTRTVGAGTDEHRQVVVIGDPSTAANVAAVDNQADGVDAATRRALAVTAQLLVWDGSGWDPITKAETVPTSAIPVWAGNQGWDSAATASIMVKARPATPGASSGHLVVFPDTLPKVYSVSGSLGITTAATWDERLLSAVPTNYVFKPKLARCAVTTAATRTLIGIGKKLATWNPGTNTFASVATVSAPDFYDRLMYRIASTHSATATTVTATYTDQDGNTGNSTGGLVIPASAAAGDWYEFVMAANDFGVRAVTNASDTANPTTVVDEIWGIRTLLEDLGPANTPQIANLGEGLGSNAINDGESVVILFNAAATTAQQRFASVIGDLISG